MKLGIIGASAVGAGCLTSVLVRGFAQEVIVLDRDRKRARGLVTDVQYGAVLLPTVEVRDGDYGDLAGASLVMITAGVNERDGGATDRKDSEGRLRLIDTNFPVIQEIVSRLDAIAPESIVLVLTDPPDPLADAVRLLGHERVLSTGTYLDSLRFKFHLARRLRVSPSSVEAQILGEHGTSEVFFWSSSRVGGVPALELLSHSDQDRDKIRRDIEKQVRYANISIIEDIGASHHGIGMKLRADSRHYAVLNCPDGIARTARLRSRAEKHRHCTEGDALQYPQCGPAGDQDRGHSRLPLAASQ